MLKKPTRAELEAMPDIELLAWLALCYAVADDAGKQKIESITPAPWLEEITSKDLQERIVADCQISK